MRAPFERFARILDYPGPGLPDELGACAEALAAEHPKAAEKLRAFAEAARQQGIRALQRQYAAAFDLDPACALYAGHQLLGEGWRRSVLMAELRQHFRDAGFEDPGELPDHLCTLLRFLERFPDAEDGPELVDACLVPALSRIREGLARRRNAYEPVVAAIAEALGAA